MISGTRHQFFCASPDLFFTWPSLTSYGATVEKDIATPRRANPNPIASSVIILLRRRDKTRRKPSAKVSTTPVVHVLKKNLRKNVKLAAVSCYTSFGNNQIRDVRAGRNSRRPRTGSAPRPPGSRYRNGLPTARGRGRRAASRRVDRATATTRRRFVSVLSPPAPSSPCGEVDAGRRADAVHPTGSAL